MSNVLKPEIKELDVALKALTWTEFFPFALQLGVDDATLRKIEEIKQDTDDRKRLALKHWLKNDEQASWKKVADCLEVADMKVLAANLRKEKSITDIC